MKTPFARLVQLLLLLILITGTASAQSYPSSFECRVRPWYKHRKDGKPGREVTLYFKGKLAGPATVRIECTGVTEETTADPAGAADSLSVLLPAGVGVKQGVQARISVIAKDKEIYRSVMVPAQRQWTVYIYPHSHVDIGYTNTQEFVRKLHMRNIDVAIDIAKKTQNYPEGSRFVWNPEADWVTENYLQEATPEKRRIFVDAVKKGWISLDGDYANLNTSTCSDEELLRLFHSKKQIETVTGKPIKTMVQMDVAGAAWGLTQAAYQNGIRGFFLYPNVGTVRWPWEHRPFYWVAPDGRSKIFFLQALPYGFGYTIKGSKIGLRKIQGNIPDLDRIKTDDPTVNFIDPMIFQETARQEYDGSPYDIFVLPWALADNALIDADLPDAVRLWNEKYAYPKLIISGSQRIMDDYEKRFGSIIPEVKGDYTEYWTDGLGSDARRIGLYRQGKENLVQMETAWSMLNSKKPSPRIAIDTAWQNSLLGAEHTWGYQDSKAPLAKRIEDKKAAFFDNTFKGSNDLLAETFKSIAKQGSNKIAIFNTLSWERGGLITLTKQQSQTGDRMLDEKGNAVPSQRLSTGELVFMAASIPALSSRTYTLTAGSPEKAGGCSINGNTITNGRIAVSIDHRTGDIISLIDKHTGHEYVDKHSEYSLNSYRYLTGWDSLEKVEAPAHVELQVKENGPLVVSIEVSSKAPGCNWLKREAKLVAGQSWLDITNSFDKISTQTKEGVHFGFAFNIPDGTTRLDIPWGVMIPEYDQLPAGNRSWLTFQRWADISNSQHGITWTCIESPLIEMDHMSANLRGGAHGSQNWYKHLPQSQTLFSWVLNNHWGTNFPLEQGGVMSFHYGLMPHGAYNATAANRFGMEQNRPLLAVPVAGNINVKTPVIIDNPNVFISTLKQSDNGKGMILRLRSMSDRPEKVVLGWPNGKPHKLYNCLADEKLLSPVVADQTVLPQGTVSYYFEP